MRTPRDASPALVALDFTSLKWESKRQSYDRFRRGKALFVRCGAGTRSDVLAGKLPFLPGGFDIASNLIQVRKVMTRQESQHHIQGLQTALIVLAGALQIRRRCPSPHRQIKLAQHPKDFY